MFTVSMFDYSALSSYNHLPNPVRLKKVLEGL
jgi:hypothetical protein